MFTIAAKTIGFAHLQGRLAFPKIEKAFELLSFTIPDTNPSL